LDTAGITAGQVVSLESEYGLQAVAALLALFHRRAIVVPLSRDAASQHELFLALASVQHRVNLSGEQPTVASTGCTANHDLYQTLRQRRHPGLVLFTSGSTGAAKAVVHDVAMLLEKYRLPRQRLRTIVFLQLDHIGGVNTLLYTLSNGGAVVVPVSRSPAAVCRAIAEHRVQLLPTSPTFLNLLLLSHQTHQWDLSSLELITYGTEPMPQSTLNRVAELFPSVKLQQTYGMTELGILRSKSRGSDSLWFRIGGEGFEVKIRDGRLWVKAQSAMLGYLNAPAPFDEEGYFDTGDMVETDGDWVRILGRHSDVINVGGNKISPAQVESVLLEIPGVLDAAVHGAAHAITGRIVAAVVQMDPLPELRQFKVRMRQYCASRLPGYAVPMQVQLTDQPLHSSRFKRMRQPAAVNPGGPP
jgi:long-chain acyl-CoA synthetase